MTLHLFPDKSLSVASAILSERHEREKLLPRLKDAEWMMLVDLWASELRGNLMTVGDLQVGAYAPATTALRHIVRLERKGLIERHPDPMDGRRVFVRLTKGAIERLRELAMLWRLK